MLFLGSLAGSGLWLIAISLYIIYNLVKSLAEALGTHLGSHSPRLPLKHERAICLLIGFGPLTLLTLLALSGVK